MGEEPFSMNEIHTKKPYLFKVDDTCWCKKEAELLFHHAIVENTVFLIHLLLITINMNIVINYYRTDENKSRYTKQRNYCVSLLRKTKTQYYSNLNEKNVTEK